MRMVALRQVQGDVCEVMTGDLLLALAAGREAGQLPMMTVDLFLALLLFAFVMSVTPGPNNVMLLASGVNYGFRRSLPHMLGITIGFSFMIVVVGLGLGQVFERFPVTYEIMRYGGGAYMLWLAWRIANSGPVGEGKTSGSPMTFTHDLIGHRKPLEDLPKAQAYDQDHETEANGDSKHVRNAALETVVHARCQKHDVVWPRRHRHDKGKDHERQK